MLESFLDLMLVEQNGVGPIGIGFIILLGSWLYIFWKYHMLVRDHFKDEIDRISTERDKWENRFFAGQLLSSESDHYESQPRTVKDAEESEDA